MKAGGNKGRLPAKYSQIRKAVVFKGFCWLKAKVNNLNPAPFNKIGLVITHQILKETLEQFLIYCQ